MSEDQIGKAVMECYRRMFKEADPSGDIDEIIKSGEGKQKDFFMNYYLHQDRQDEIIEEVCKDLKIRNIYRTKVFNSVILGSAPTGFSKPEGSGAGGTK